MSCKRDNSFSFVMYSSPLTSEVNLLVNLFEKPVHNVVRHFSCFLSETTRQAGK